MPRWTKTFEERFADKVLVTEGCHVWTGARSKKGYGQIYRDGELLYAHRVVCERKHGPLPPGIEACHSCDTPWCVREDHIFPGTRAQNAADMVAKGRSAGGSSPGESHPLHKLTDEQVIAIRREYAVGGMTYRELGERYGVKRGMIGKIVRRVCWRHVG